MSSRLRVLLLFGGRSAEHDVSRRSAASVAAALDPARYEVVPVAITKDGHWLLAGEAQAALATGLAALPSELAVEGTPVAELAEPDPAGLVVMGGEAGPRAPAGRVGFDVVLPMLHGPYGEDGTVQGLLELAGVAYVGSGVLGSAVGMDKVMMKQAFRSQGLPTPDFLAFRDGHDVAGFIAAVEARLGYPCFVKPANLGSSVGVSRARDRDELVRALAHALEFDEWALAEEAVAGREIEVAVLGDDPPEASVPGEIVPGGDFYSYAAKYDEDTAALLVPAPLSGADSEDVRQLAVRAFEACRLEAMARVDFFFERERADGRPGRGFLVNEVNTIPGFTSISMYPRLWAASGLPYPALLDRLIDLALARAARRTTRAGRQRPA